MQLNEHEIFENLTHHCATIVEQFYTTVAQDSRGFTLQVRQVYSADAVYEYVEQLEYYLNVIQQAQLNMPLTVKKINKLLQYLD